MKEIYLAGAFYIDETLNYNLTRQFSVPFQTFFPFFQICPGAVIRQAGQAPASRDSALVVINLTDKVWNEIKDTLPFYGRTVLLQTEAYINYEVAYEQASRFDVFVNFDSTYASHPGFLHAYAPYIPYLPFSVRDARGLVAMRDQWRYSGRVFLDAYIFRFLPRHRKASFIITLRSQQHYQVRLRVARRWTEQVDVFGGAWPKDLPSWHGRCGDKIAVASRYRYALVMESQRQPGYVTEKLLDAFAAGAVPIYWGAPDVSLLPGASAIVPFTDENFPVGQVIADDAGYQTRRKALLASRKALFDVFSPKRYIQVLTHALKG